MKTWRRADVLLAIANGWEESPTEPPALATDSPLWETKSLGDGLDTGDLAHPAAAIPAKIASKPFNTPEFGKNYDVEGYTFSPLVLLRLDPRPTLREIAAILPPPFDHMESVRRQRWWLHDYDGESKAANIEGCFAIDKAQDAERLKRAYAVWSRETEPMGRDESCLSSATGLAAMPAGISATNGKYQYREAPVSWKLKRQIRTEEWSKHGGSTGQQAPKPENAPRDANDPVGPSRYPGRTEYYKLERIDPESLPPDVRAGRQRDISEREADKHWWRFVGDAWNKGRELPSRYLRCEGHAGRYRPDADCPRCRELNPIRNHNLALPALSRLGCAIPFPDQWREAPKNRGIAAGVSTEGRNVETGEVVRWQRPEEARRKASALKTLYARCDPTTELGGEWGTVRREFGVGVESEAWTIVFMMVRAEEARVKARTMAHLLAA